MIDYITIVAVVIILRALYVLNRCLKIKKQTGQLPQVDLFYINAFIGYYNRNIWNHTYLAILWLIYRFFKEFG